MALVYIDNKVEVAYDKYSVPNKFRFIVFLVIAVLAGMMLFFIFSGSKNPSPQPTSNNSALPPFNKSVSSDPLSPIRKNATAQTPKQVITIESKVPGIKPELININQLNEELTKIGFWDKEAILFSSPQKKTGILQNEPVTRASVKSLQITIDLNKNPKEVNPDIQQSEGTSLIPATKTGVTTEGEKYIILFTLHPYMLNFDYQTLGSHLSHSLLQAAWESTQHSPLDSAAGHPTANLYALKILQNTPQFSYIRLRK